MPEAIRNVFSEILELVEIGEGKYKKRLFLNNLYVQDIPKTVLNSHEKETIYAALRDYLEKLTDHCLEVIVALIYLGSNEGDNYSHAFAMAKKWDRSTCILNILENRSSGPFLKAGRSRLENEGLTLEKILEECDLPHAASLK